MQAVSQEPASSPTQTAEQTKVLSLENEGLLFTDNNAGVSGVDVASSVPIDGGAIWFFGDVFLLGPVGAPLQSYVGNVSNCALWVPTGKGPAPLSHYRFFVDPTTKLARQLIPLLKGEGQETRLWPCSGWYNPASKKVYLYYSINRTTGPGPFGFKVEGFGLAMASLKEKPLHFVRITSPSSDTIWWHLVEGVAFGCAVVWGAPGPYLYIVGVDNSGHHFGKLARVLKTRVADVSAYEYFAGYENRSDAPKWSRNVQDAANVEGLSEFPNELSVAYNAYLKRYLAVYADGVLSQRALLCAAREPWGPYKRIGEISIAHKAFSSAFCYACKEHPELAERNGQVLYVTYVDSDRYWPQLLKVTLQTIK